MYLHKSAELEFITSEGAEQHMSVDFSGNSDE